MSLYALPFCDGVDRGGSEDVKPSTEIGERMGWTWHPVLARTTMILNLWNGPEKEHRQLRPVSGGIWRIPGLMQTRWLELHTPLNLPPGVKGCEHFARGLGMVGYVWHVTSAPGRGFDSCQIDLTAQQMRCREHGRCITHVPSLWL